MPPTILSTQFSLPASVISNTGWQNPDNILLLDGDTADSNSTQSDSLIVGDFALLPNPPGDIPQNGVIVGIEVQVTGYRGAQTSPPVSLTLSAVDDTSGTQLFYPYTAPFTGFTTAMATYTLGGPNYTFATSFTPDQINNIKLALASNGPLFIDAILIKIYYYLDTSGTPTPVDPGECLDCDSPLQAQPFYLALPVNGTDTSYYVQSFNYPDGTPIQISDAASCGTPYIDLVFDEGRPRGNGENFEENIRIFDVTHLPNGTVRLDSNAITDRGLLFRPPYTHDATIISAHNANAKVIISNSAPFYDRFLRKCHIGQLVSAPIEVQDEGVQLTDRADRFNFTGAGVTVIEDQPDKVQVIIPGGGGTTPPTVVEVSTCTSGDVRVSSIECSHSSTGVNRLLVTQVSLENGQTVTGITFNGIAMSLDVAVQNGDTRMESWSLVAPSVGIFDVIVTFSGPTYCSMGTETIVGVDQATPIGTTQSAVGTSLAPSLVLATLFDNSLVIDGLATAQVPILHTPGPGQILNWTRVANTDLAQGSSSVELAGTAPDVVTMDYSITQNTDWSVVAVEVKGITSLVSALTVEDEGVVVDSGTSVIDFVGAGVTAIQTVPGQVQVTIPGGGGTGTSLGIDIKQIAHGFSVGDVIKSSGVDDEFALAQADTRANSEAVGIVTVIIGPDDFTYVSSAVQISGAFVPVAVPGTAVWLDPVVAGGLTTTEPSTVGQIKRGLGTIIASGATMYFDIAALAEEITASSSGLSIVRTYDLAGSPHTWTKPANLAYIVAEGVGAGAGGGSGLDAANGGGGGGGGGGYCRATIDAASLGATETVTIGAGGAGGNNGAGSAGGNTTFGTVPIITANGGSGGSQAGASGAAGGRGGVASGGDLNAGGGVGGYGTPTGVLAGQAGQGGNSIWGGGGRGGPNSGENGYDYGGGGTGGVGGSAVVGGDGADGFCVVTEYYL